jgi:cytochrome c biogenesis protein CcdA
MVESKKVFCLVFFVFLLFVEIACSTTHVTVEFLYWNPRTDKHFCEECPDWIDFYETFLRKNETVNRLQSNYTGQVLFDWIEFESENGTAESRLYNIFQPNSIVIKGEEGNVTVVEGDFNETYIREHIDAYLEKALPPPPPSPMPLIAVLAVAFSVGVVRPFSPCVIALLSFLLSYTVGKTTRFRQGLSEVMAFAGGFVLAAVGLGLTIGLMFLSFEPYYNILVWVAALFGIFFGLNLLIDFPKLLNIKFKTRPLIRFSALLTRKYTLTYGGVFLLGFIFYFLDPCLAPVLVFNMLVLRPEYLVPTLLVFGLGILTPFVGFGMVAGSVSNLTKSSHKHKSKIRAISGLILIAYSTYFIVHLIL